MNDTPTNLDGQTPAGEISSPSTSTPVSNQKPDALTPKQALELLVQDPIAFIQTLIENAAQSHLANLKEEAELRGALNVFRKTHPEFAQFEPFILQEAVSLIQNDADGAIEPWPQLLEKAMDHFKQKFADTVRASQMHTPSEPEKAPYMETAANRTVPEMPQSFTREQIAKMSLRDFLKNEAAINSALQQNRIR
jgi:hypothetical protein